MTARIRVSDVKMTSEALKIAQGWSSRDGGKRIGELIAECDRLRPLGSDGKHGNQHTPYCGCADLSLSERLRAWVQWWLPSLGEVLR